MKIRISEIKINPGRRTAAPVDVQKLAESMAEVGLMHPITVDADRNLIAGLHRLEAGKLLGWTEIECMVSPLDELHAELSEIDENYVRANLTPLQASQLLLRRKEIYEALHPETKAGAAQGNGMKRSADSDLTDDLSARPKSFAQNAAEMLGVNERTVRRQVKIAQDLTPEAKEIIGESGMKVTQQALSQLSRLAPEQQTEAAEKLVSGHSEAEVNEDEGEDDDDDDDGDEIVNSRAYMNASIARFLNEFRQYAEHFPRRLAGFFEDIDACGALLTAAERQTLRRQATSMMEVLTSLSDKIMEAKEI